MAMRLEDVAARALALVAKALVAKVLVAKVHQGRNPRRALYYLLEARCATRRITTTAGAIRSATRHCRVG